MDSSELHELQRKQMEQDAINAQIVIENRALRETTQCQIEEFQTCIERVQNAFMSSLWGQICEIGAVRLTNVLSGLVAGISSSIPANHRGSQLSPDLLLGFRNIAFRNDYRLNLPIVTPSETHTVNLTNNIAYSSKFDYLFGDLSLRGQDFTHPQPQVGFPDSVMNLIGGCNFVL